MPEHMQRVTGHMVRHDWFHSYMELENIGYALDRVAGRIRFSNTFSGIIEEIREHDQQLERRFLCFFPELQHCAKEDP